MNNEMNNKNNTNTNNTTTRARNYYAPRLVRIKTVRRANGRTFSVAYYDDGTTADLD